MTSSATVASEAEYMAADCHAMIASLFMTFRHSFSLADTDAGFDACEFPAACQPFSALTPTNGNHRVMSLSCESYPTRVSRSSHQQTANQICHSQLEDSDTFTDDFSSPTTHLSLLCLR